jgi:hypothetical protein
VMAESGTCPTVHAGGASLGLGASTEARTRQQQLLGSCFERLGSFLDLSEVDLDGLKNMCSTLAPKGPQGLIRPAAAGLGHVPYGLGLTPGHLISVVGQV